MDGTEFTVPESYKLVTKLGQGSFGVVAWFEIPTADGTQQVAVKKIERTFDSDCEGGRREAQMVVREVRLLRHMAHDNLIRIVDLLPPANAASPAGEARAPTEQRDLTPSGRWRGDRVARQAYWETQRATHANDLEAIHSIFLRLAAEMPDETLRQSRRTRKR